MDGQAWLDADSTTCDTPVAGKANLCDTYVKIKINGKEVYRTETKDNTAHPIFKEIFETGLIRSDAIIVFEMWDSDVGFSADDPMSTWSGNAEYYLTHHILVDNTTKGNQRNSLNVSTKLVNGKKPEGEHTISISLKLDFSLKRFKLLCDQKKFGFTFPFNFINSFEFS